jgi:hypothetical protein
LIGEATAVERSEDGIGREVRAALHEEINRLPREARMALVVCDLEGRSSRSTAKQLGWTVAKLERRLAQARRRLHDRLARRGVFLTAPQAIGELLHIGEPVISRHLIEKTVALASRQGSWHDAGTGRHWHLHRDCGADRPYSVGVWSAEEVE